ncbi:UDP-glucose/GDP-mannose dehydrogenase family protein [Streptomyces nodosus]|uniref:UDP-glucose dehydrogenase family protein n=1 Tax=Streptomyces nodosus TaxID=40318 RepID=UPI003454F34B
MRVSVIGCGHLGIPHAAAMAEIGHEVIGVDTDHTKVDRLNAGECPIYEAGLPELLTKHTAGGRLRFTTDPQEAAAFAELHFLGVGTPIDSDGRSYDTRQVFGAVRQLAPHLTRACTIVGKSTVAVGTTRRLTHLVQRLAPAGEQVDVVWNPEFLREGHAVEDTLRPDRIVAGLTTTAAEKAIRDVYAPILQVTGVPLFITDPATAELAKGAANTFLALKISYINGVADMCRSAGGDISQIVDILEVDGRIGRGSMSPGIGYGGGCLPKDVRAFTASARQLGADRAAALLRAAEEVNESRTAMAVGIVTRALGRPIAGAAITVWGAAFKPGTNDVRESPALALAQALHQAGASVTVHDPQAVRTAVRRSPELEYTDDLEQSVDGAHAVVLATEWPEYRGIDPTTLTDRTAEPLMVDCRTTLDADRWRTAGWTVHQIGRPEK